jgi:1-acyl-sn-glycerol-3-phosphate acyltransferase
MKLKIEGKENLPKTNENAIYFANHQSFLDIPVIQILVPTNLSFVLKKELKNFPFIGWWASYAKMVFIDRSNKEKSDKSLLKIAAQIQQGKTIGIFPEGTRNTDGKIGKIKLGGLYLASQSGAPIVPILIEGTQKLMPKYSNLLDGGSVYVKIGKPFHIPADLTYEEAEVWQEKVRVYMQEIKDEIDYPQK